MANKEPQSYGSQAEWVTGQTGQEVNRQKGKPNSQHGDFYESRRDGQAVSDNAGGQVSDVQLAENAQPAGGASGESDPATKVTDQAGGAKRGGFFRDRDYK